MNCPYCNTGELEFEIDGIGEQEDVTIRCNMCQLQWWPKKED